MITTPRFTWSSAFRTDVGKVRQVNEDSCLNTPAKELWAVADGMGGHSVGDVASRMVVDALGVIPAAASLGAFVNDVRACLQKVNQQLRDEAIARGQEIIGCTVVVLLAHGRHCVYLWAGDSRIYLYRDGKLRQLSRDHSQIEELIARGLLAREDAENHPLAGVITRAVGADEALELDDRMLEVKDGDIFLLCSDGLSNEVSDTEMEKELAWGDCERAAENLVGKALTRGAPDNVTVVIARGDDELGADKTVINPTALANKARS
jgi:protein phosphatase